MCCVSHDRKWNAGTFFSDKNPLEFNLINPCYRRNEVEAKLRNVKSLCKLVSQVRIKVFDKNSK